MAELQLLGPVCMRDGDRVVELGPPKQRAVLVALLADAGRPVSVDTLVARVWGERSPAQARSALYTHIMRIRQLATQVPIEVQHGPAGYTATVDRAAVDLFRFQDLLARATSEPPDESTRLVLLRDAIGLWSGQPLADLSGEWIDRTRQEWRRQYLDAALAWARAELHAGDAARVPGPIRALTAEYPLVEPLMTVLLEALAALGRGAEALDLYAAFRRELTEELGTDPGPELQAVHRALLRRGHDRPPDPPAAPATQIARATRVRRRTLIVSWSLTAAAVTGLLVMAVPRSTGPSSATLSPIDRPAGPTWQAHTVSDAPLFVAAGQVVLTVPAYAKVRVTCRYAGQPPSPWRSSGTEYHVSAPSSGHIPDQYLAFDEPPPVNVPHCHAKHPR